MSARKKSIKVTQSERRIRARRITVHSSANAGKQAQIVEHFEAVKAIKNAMSAHVFEHRVLLLSADDRYTLQSQHYKQFRSPHLSAWETQQLFQCVADAYVNTLEQRRKNHNFAVMNGTRITRYKRDLHSKSGDLLHREGDVRSFEVVLKQTPLSRVLNWLTVFTPEQMETVEKQVKLKPDETAGSPAFVKRLEATRQFNLELNRIRQSPDKWCRVKQLIAARRQHDLKQLTLQVHHSGNYRKAVREGAKTAAPGTFLYRDTSNALYQTWFRFKTPQWTLDLPLAVNRNYHDLTKVQSEANLLVTLNRKGRLQICLACEVDQHFESTVATEQIAGIDLNVKDNFCTIGLHDQTVTVDYDRTFLKSQFDKIRAFDEKGYQHLNETDLRVLRKVREQTECYFRRQISAMLDDLCERHITEIVLEDLNLAKTAGRGDPVNDYFGVSYRRLVRWLRLGNIKHWFRQQGNNRCLRVHFTPSCYTSQECSACHYIDRGNRCQQAFVCKLCGHKAHSDKNASHSIRSRVTTDVLCPQLHVLKDGQFDSKRLRRETVKRIIEQHFKPDKVLNALSAAA
jgi:hypothetical protein